MGSIESGFTYLTYEDAAAALRIKPDSVRRRAASRKWPRTLGNDKLARVGIPNHLLPQASPDATPAPTPEDPDVSDRGGASTDALELAAERARADTLKRQVEDLQAERDRLLALVERLSEPRPGLVERWLRAWRS